jgi:endonuclease-3
VNVVTPGLFARYPTVSDLVSAERSELEEIIRSTGFFRNKAKSIQGTAARIASDFRGEVPRTMEELLSLPGVARKTANVVLGTAFGIADGFVVDTHVFRLSHRLGFAKGKNPEQVEQELMKLVPREDWIDLAHILIHHGRRVCAARAPDCESCVVSSLCPKIGVVAKKAAKEPPAKPKAPLKERIAKAARSRTRR